jgi:hypothetical protein
LQEVSNADARLWYKAHGQPGTILIDTENALSPNDPIPLFSFPPSSSSSSSSSVSRRPDDITVSMQTSGAGASAASSAPRRSTTVSEPRVHTGGRQGFETLEALEIASGDLILVETKLPVR